MRRRLFTLCSAVSLLLCVVVCGLWVRSSFVRDAIQCVEERSAPDGSATRDSREWYVARGHLAYTRQVTTYPAIAGADLGPAAALSQPGPGQAVGRRWTWAREEARWTTPTDTLPRRLGFGSATVSPPRLPSAAGLTYAAVWGPLWAVGLATAVLPARWVTAIRGRHRRRRRAARGLCPACGYDLRATPGRCPECGTVIRSPVQR